jgi:hypothetical protein
MRVKQRHRLFRVGRFKHGETRFFQPVAIVDTDQLLILDDKDGMVDRSGISTQTQPPHL